MNKFSRFTLSQIRRLPVLACSLLYAGEKGCCSAGDELPGGADVALLQSQTQGQSIGPERSSVPACQM